MNARPLDDDAYSVVGRVSVAAAIASVERPHIPPVRYCPECGAIQEPGRVRCKECVS